MDASVDDYFLVEFRISGRKKFYIGIITKERDTLTVIMNSVSSEQVPRK
jgi:hypothetical protein